MGTPSCSCNQEPAARSGSHRAPGAWAGGRALWVGGSPVTTVSKGFLSALTVPAWTCLDLQAPDAGLHGIGTVDCQNPGWYSYPERNAA